MPSSQGPASAAVAAKICAAAIAASAVLHFICVSPFDWRCRGEIAAQAFGWNVQMGLDDPSKLISSFTPIMPIISSSDQGTGNDLLLRSAGTGGPGPDRG